MAMAPMSKPAKAINRMRLCSQGERQNMPLGLPLQQVDSAALC